MKQTTVILLLKVLLACAICLGTVVGVVLLVEWLFFS